MWRNAIDKNFNVIYLGDRNINFRSDLPRNVLDTVNMNGFINIISEPTHLDLRAGGTSLFDPIFVTVSIKVQDL